MITEGKLLDLLTNSLNLYLREMYGDQYGEFVCGYGANGVKNVSEYQERSSATLKRIIVTFNVVIVVICLLVCLFAFCVE